MHLTEYFDRIGFAGAPAADLHTMKAVHRAHVQSISYENLDVQLGVPVTRKVEDAFDKIVRRGRGGWCYEMNGLLGWALEEIGFDVRRLAGAVMRDFAGDGVIGNHLVLLVDVQGSDWVCDVGFGAGLIVPTPLAAGPLKSNPLDCHLIDLGEGWWRYEDDPRTGGPNFDFNIAIDDEALLESRCRYLQSDPASPFVLNAVAQRWKGERHLSMRGRVLRELTPTDESQRIIQTAEEYVGVLKDEFGINLPEAASLWPSICRRHEEVFAKAG